MDFRDLIAPVDPSFIYPCGDIGSLAALLRRAFSDPHKLAKLRAAARERMTTWSPREYIAATLEAVERAVSHLRPIA